MKKLFCIFFLLMGIGLYAGEEAMDIFKKSDNSFIPNEARFTFKMENYIDNQFSTYSVYEGYIKGLDRYVLIGLEPAPIKGIVDMRKNDIIFNYVKKIDRLNQVAAKMAFLDSVLSQEDVMSLKLSKFYDIENYKVTQIDGKNVYQMNLQAKSLEQAYNKIISYIDEKSYFLVKREYFSYSGEKIKEMKVDSIIMEKDKLKYLKFTMFDILRKGDYTIVEISNLEYDKPVKETYFNPQSLKMLAK